MFYGIFYCGLFMARSLICEFVVLTLNPLPMPNSIRNFANSRQILALLMSTPESGS